MLNVNKKKVAVSIFFTAFAFGLNIVGISPVLGIINEKYQQYGTSAIQLLQTIQYMLIMVGSLMIGWLTTKISKKKIVLAGLAIIGICGLMPFFSDNFWVLVVSKIDWIWIWYYRSDEYSNRGRIDSGRRTCRLYGTSRSRYGNRNDGRKYARWYAGRIQLSKLLSRLSDSIHRNGWCADAFGRDSTNKNRKSIGYEIK